MQTAESRHEFEETLTRLREAMEQRGLTIFADIDHAAGARGAGMELPDEVVIVFGNARAGTPLMQADPRVGLELPLRILVWAESDSVRLGYRDPRELADSYALGDHRATLDAMSVLLGDLVDVVARS